MGGKSALAQANLLLRRRPSPSHTTGLRNIVCEPSVSTIFWRRWRRQQLRDLREHVPTCEGHGEHDRPQSGLPRDGLNKLSVFIEFVMVIIP